MASCCGPMLGWSVGWAKRSHAGDLMQGLCPRANRTSTCCAVSTHAGEPKESTRSVVAGRRRSCAHRVAAHWRMVPADMCQDENATRCPVNPLTISNAAAVGYAHSIVDALYGRNAFAGVPRLAWDYRIRPGISCMTIQMVALRGPSALGEPTQHLKH